MWTFLLHDSFLSCFLCFLLCDWLLMVRMRPCADGAQAPHWLPLCSCYCCHCSCAVSGQFHNASSFFFINVILFSVMTVAHFPILFVVFLVACSPLFKHLCFVPLLHVFFHCFPALICLTCHSFLCSTIWLHLPPDLPPRLFLPLTNIFPISPDFEPQAMLFVSFPIIIRLRQYDSSVYLCCHLISDVARCSLKQTTHFSFVSKRLFISFNDSQLFFLSKNKPRQDMFFLVPLQMLSIQRVGVWMIGFGQT